MQMPDSGKFLPSNAGRYRNRVSARRYHLPLFFALAFNRLGWKRQQFVDAAVGPGGEFLEGVL
jgi:hypothetical protein